MFLQNWLHCYVSNDVYLKYILWDKDQVCAANSHLSKTQHHINRRPTKTLCLFNYHSLTRSKIFYESKIKVTLIWMYICG